MRAFAETPCRIRCHGQFGGILSLLGFWRRIEATVSLLGGSAKTPSCLRLRLRGIAFGGVLSLLGLFSRFLHLTAFLLFVANTRVLTIAHVVVNSQDSWLVKPAKCCFSGVTQNRKKNPTLPRLQDARIKSAWSKWWIEGDRPPWTANMLPPICAETDFFQDF